MPNKYMEQLVWIRENVNFSWKRRENKFYTIWDWKDSMIIAWKNSSK